jgi:hypothetical protein
MPKSSIILVAPVLAALAGCTPTIWDKADATRADYNRESYECERDLRQSRTGSGLLGALDAHGFYNRCMSAHGYYPQGGTAIGLKPAAADPASSSSGIAGGAGASPTDPALRY